MRGFLKSAGVAGFCISALAGALVRPTGAADLKKAGVSSPAAIQAVATNGPKPLARYYVAALGGYLTGADTQLTIAAPTDSAAAGDRKSTRLNSSHT